MTGSDPDPSSSARESTTDAGSILIRNATIVTMNDRLDIVDGAVTIRDGRIVSVGADPGRRYARVIDAGGGYLLPGFIQTHIHLCQTVFRGSADDMPLLEWLKRRLALGGRPHARDPARLSAACRCRTAPVGDNFRADDGDRSRYRCGVRDVGTDGPARIRR
jgi:hypothetical protein